MRVFLALLLLFPASALPQAFPSKPLRLVIPFGPGGVADITTRSLARSSSSAQLREFFISEARRWSQVVEAAKIPKQ